MDKNKDFIINLKNHLSLLSEVLSISIRIKDLSYQANNIDDILVEVDNRDRLIRILSDYQLKIEEDITNLIQGDVEDKTVKKLNHWRAEVSSKIDLISHIDNLIVETLSQNKNKISQEIAMLFKRRKGFEGYNLRNVKG